MAGACMQLVSTCLLFLLSYVHISAAGPRSWNDIARRNFCNGLALSVAATKLIIAHRGAAAYLPEHTLAAKALAIGMGADYIEQDIVLSKDDKLLILHDHFLDTTTDVASVFPDRKRDDGRYYAIDFTWAEIKQLKKSEPFSHSNASKPDFGGRFPLWGSSFRVNTLEEELEMVRGMEKSMGRTIGITHKLDEQFVKHQFSLVLEALKRYNYVSKEDSCFLQCFTVAELIRIKEELMPAMEMDLKLVQLMAITSWNYDYVEVNGTLEPYNYDWMFETGAMERIAAYADGVGPWKPMVITNNSTKDDIHTTDLVDKAHRQGLFVHAYTFRADEGRVVSFAESFEDMVRIFFQVGGLDGIFTDFPDRAVKALNRR